MLAIVLLRRASARVRWRVLAALIGVGAAAEGLAGAPAEAVLAGAALCLLAGVAGQAALTLGAAATRRTALALIGIGTLLMPARAWIGAVPPLNPLSVAVVSSVPLGPLAVGADERGAALLRALGRVGPVALLDAVPTRGPATDRLVLFQPRALSPAELVAIDGWVRRGGRALVLADPQFDWPRPFPFGDPRNPQATSLLDPLLEHWGARLELDDPAAARPNDAALPSPGELRALTPACRPLAGQRALRCAVGEGVALVVADADWLDPAGWPARPARREQLARAIRSGRIDPPGWGPAAELLIGLLLFAAVLRTGREDKKNIQ